MLAHAGGRLGILGLLVVDGDRFQILGLEDLMTIETLHVIDSVSTS
jgi:hypothetical protein